MHILCVFPPKNRYKMDVIDIVRSWFTVRSSSPFFVKINIFSNIPRFPTFGEAIGRSVDRQSRRRHYSLVAVGRSVVLLSFTRSIHLLVAGVL